MTLREAFAASSLPTLDTEVLAACVIEQDRTWILTHPEYELTPEQLKRLQQFMADAAAGTPIAYLTGEKEFFGHTFRVTRDTLIPRPDSEMLVEQAVGLLKHEKNPLVVDVGTGTGCLLISVLKELPGARGLGLDLSAAALAVATDNAQRLGVADRMETRQGDLLTPLSQEQTPALLLANLPYLTTAEAAVKELQFEPASALDGGVDGLNHYRGLFAQLRTRPPVPSVLCEISPTIKTDFLRIAKSAGYTGAVETDLGGWPRLAVLTPIV